MEHAEKVIGFNFIGAELPTGGSAPKLPRMAFVGILEEAKVSAAGNGINFQLVPAPGQRDMENKPLNPTSYRPVYTHVTFPKPDDGPDSFPQRQWMLIFHTLGMSLEKLKQTASGMTVAMIMQMLAGVNGVKPRFLVDYTPDTRERSYTDDSGKEKKVKDDAVWLMTKEDFQKLDARLRGEASVAAPAQQAATTQAAPAQQAAAFNPMAQGAGAAGFGVPTTTNGMQANGAGVVQAPVGGLAGMLGGFGGT